MQQPLELGRAHDDVAKNAAEGTDLERAVAMDKHRGPVVAALQDVMAAAHADDGKTLFFQEADHLLTRRPR